MPRPPRIHLNGALYHITCTAAHETLLFRDDQDYKAYVELLQSCRDRLGFKLFSYVLFPSQIHLCLELTGSASLSTIMHAVSSRYTKYMGKRYGHTGHLFQRRFQSTLLEKEPWLLRVTGYLHTLPRRTGMAADLSTYQWSSHPTYLLTRGPSAIGPILFTEVHEVLDHLSRECPNLSYEAYLNQVPETDWEEVGKQLQRHVVGSEAFKALVAQHSQASAVRPEVEPTRPSPQPQPSPMPRRHPTVALTASVWLAFFSTCAAGLYSQNLAALKQTVQVLSQELVLARTAPVETAEGVMRATLATFRSFAGGPSAGLARSTTLNGTRWDVKLRPMDQTGQAVGQADELRFERNMVLSLQLLAKGFVPTQYSSALKADGTVVWETVQTASGGEVARWHGERRGELMHGILTLQIPGQAAMGYEFVGASRSEGPSKLLKETREI